jgi:hypothetical protein
MPGKCGNQKLFVLSVCQYFYDAGCSGRLIARREARIFSVFPKRDSVLLPALSDPTVPFK